MPGGQPRGGVGAENQKDLLVVGERLQRVDGECGAVPGQLAVIDAEALHGSDGQAGHRQPVGRVADLATGFLPGVSRRHEQDPIELSLVERRFRGVQVADVNRVEGPAEDSGSHGFEDRAEEA